MEGEEDGQAALRVVGVDAVDTDEVLEDLHGGREEEVGGEEAEEASQARRRAGELLGVGVVGAEGGGRVVEEGGGSGVGEGLEAHV